MEGKEYYDLSLEFISFTIMSTLALVPLQLELQSRVNKATAIYTQCAIGFLPSATCKFGAEKWRENLEATDRASSNVRQEVRAAARPMNVPPPMLRARTGMCSLSTGSAWAPARGLRLKPPTKRLPSRFFWRCDAVVLLLLLV